MCATTIYKEAEARPVTKRFLKRPGVEALLKDAFQKPLAIVTAGAGYGKTQAVLAALKTMKCKSAWIQLSQLDNNISRFWERVAYAFEPYSLNLCESLISLGYPESIVAFDQFLNLLAKKLTHKEPFILVFDDFHLIHNKTILSFIELFVFAHIQDFSIVLISRSKPELSLAGMESKGLLTRVVEDDLRFSKNEMEEYFQKQNIDVDEKIAQDIYVKTDGWIFAIYLVGLAIKKGDLNKQNPMLAAKIDIFDMIEKEIFLPAPIMLQDFLIKLSIFDNIPYGLLKKLAQNDLSLISEMMNISLFIRHDSLSDSYYIQHLFREFLLERKGQLKKNAVKKVHLTAAEWFLKNNRKFEALEHYKACNLYNKIFDIILSISQHVPKEAADSFITYIEQAPEKLMKERPIIRVARAKYMFNNNRLEEAKRELVNLREEFEALPETEENRAVLGEVYLGLAVISIIDIDYAFVELFKLANQYLPNGSKLMDHRTNLAEGSNICSIKDHAAGALKQHQDALFRAAPYASRVMNGCTHGMEYLNAAESSLYTGELKDAEKYTYEAIYRSRQYQQYGFEYMANFVLIRILTAKGDYAKISELLNQMKIQLENLNVSSCIPLYDIINGWFYLKIGKTERIAQWIKHEDGIQKKLPPVALGREYLVLSDYLLAERRYYELLAFMEQTDRIYEARGILYARIQNKITRAIIHHYMGNYEESLKSLHESYALTYPNNLVIQYIEYGNQMRTLIHSVRQNKTCTIPKDWLDKIYTKSSTYAKQLAQIIFSYDKDHALQSENQAKLSKRELEVLTCLVRGLTRKEIAEICYLSLGTVNDIMNNIYTKLGASNAVDAVRIAKEKNLL